MGAMQASVPIPMPEKVGGEGQTGLGGLQGGMERTSEGPAENQCGIVAGTSLHGRSEEEPAGGGRRTR